MPGTSLHTLGAAQYPRWERCWEGKIGANSESVRAADVDSLGSCSNSQGASPSAATDKNDLPEQGTRSKHLLNSDVYKVQQSAVALLVGEKVQEETTLVDDPFQMKTGGMVDMKKLKERGKDKISEEEDLHLGTSFSAETNRRDEDADMMKYIETELKKRKGIVEHEEQKVKPKNAEDCLYELPENIRVSSAKKTEEMLSNQMLSGIPEVDLGIDAKIKNIISTEDAKARLLAEQQNKKKDSETSFVPTNMAVNYVQHNRFYHEELNAPIRRNKEEPKARPLRVGDTEKPEPERSPPNRKRPANEKATDDYHYEKFKKMNRRY
ncbi:Uncharacterized protein C9orf78, partial [Eschrichtius robustus]|nr:Uncharacterized protein C9orf78 [Eschrichtius robustus]